MEENHSLITTFLNTDSIPVERKTKYIVETEVEANGAIKRSVVRANYLIWGTKSKYGFDYYQTRTFGEKWEIPPSYLGNKIKTWFRFRSP